MEGEAGADRELHAEAGADLSAELDSDLSGWTPAHYAAREGHAAALKFLQEAGHCRAAAS